MSNFQVEDSEKWPKADPSAGFRGGHQVELTYAILRCDGCQNAVVVVTDNNGEGVHWYPPQGSGVLDRQVNAAVASAYDEGMRCLSIRANGAAAVLFRSSLAYWLRGRCPSVGQKWDCCTDRLGRLRRSRATSAQVSVQWFLSLRSTSAKSAARDPL